MEKNTPQSPAEQSTTTVPLLERKCDFCNDVPALHNYDIQDFAIGGIINSTHGWCTCDTCHELVQKRERKILFERSMAHLRSNATERLVELFGSTGETIAAANDKAPQYVRKTIKDLHDKFWVAMEMAGAPKTFETPWVEALRRHKEAIHGLHYFITQSIRYLATGQTTPEFVDSMKRDMMVLQACETYAFSGTAQESIAIASESIPNSCMLSLDQIPGNGQGFWWFRPPMPWQMSKYSTVTSGFVWGMHHPFMDGNRMVIPKGTPTKELDRILEGKAYSIYFSAYVVVKRTEQHDEVPAPSTSFRWEIGDTIEQLLAKSRAEYSSRFPDDRIVGERFPGEPEDNIMGVEHHLESIASIAKFFLAACTWVGQEILEVAPGHIERHEKKRIIKKYKLSEPPNVRVISLRRRAKPETAAEIEEEKTDAKQGRTWKLTKHLVIPGFWREQPYGPGRTKRKTIYVFSYHKGPLDAPITRSRQKVLSVVR